MTDRQRGFLLASLGVAVILPDATLIRLIDASGFTTALWRSGLSAVALGGYLAIRHRSQLPQVLRDLGRWGLASAVLWGMGTVSFVLAVSFTAIANVLLILALGPMWALLLTRLVLRAPIPRHSLVVMPFAFGGVAVAVAGSLDAGIRSGDLIALLASLGMAANFTIIRAHSHIDMVPAVAVGSVMGFAGLAVAGTPFAASAGDVVPLVLLGAVVMPGAMGLLTAGARHISSPESSLLMLGETALSPIMAAIAVSEPIETAGWIGGAVVIVALTAHGWMGLREENPT